MIETKPYEISKWAVYIAYERVKANKGSYGVDEQSIEDFEKNLKTIFIKSGIECPLAAISPNQ